jgi:hypothetical protein
MLNTHAHNHVDDIRIDDMHRFFLVQPISMRSLRNRAPPRPSRVPCVRDRPSGEGLGT